MVGKSLKMGSETVDVVKFYQEGLKCSYIWLGELDQNGLIFYIESN